MEAGILWWVQRALVPLGVKARASWYAADPMPGPRSASDFLVSLSKLVGRDCLESGLADPMGLECMLGRYVCMQSAVDW